MASDWDTGALRAKLGLAGKRAREGARKGLELGSEHLLAASQARVPLEEGTLANSGKTSQDPANLQAAVSYDTPYAVIQHEDLTFRHDPGRTAKYLEGPMNEEAGTIADIIGDEVRAEMNRP